MNANDPRCERGPSAEKTAGADSLPYVAAPTQLNFAGISTPERMIIELDRTTDRELPCHDNLAFVCATKTMHAAELRCCTCDAHRGWLSKGAYNFITTTAARFGAPSEPLTLRDSAIGEHSMAKQYDNTNSGALFKNDEKEKDTHADYRGTLNVGGKEYWLNAWIKESKKDGRKYMSLSVKPKDAAAKGKGKVDLNDEIGF